MALFPKRVWSVAAVFLPGCGPEIVEAAELVEICGAEEPVQMLQLGPNERVSLSTAGLVPHGDRWLVGVDTYASPPPNGIYDADQTGSRLVSVSTCGEDATVVAEGIDLAFAPLQVEGRWHGCDRESGTVYTIDPEGEQTPEAVGYSEHCSVNHHGGGTWATLGPAAGPYTVLRLDGGSEATTVAQDVLWLQWSRDDRKLFYLTADRRLLELDIASGQTEEVTQQVARFFVTDDARFVVSSPDAELFAAVPWTILDRESGVELAGLEGQLSSDGHSVVINREDASVHVALPSLDQHTFSGQWWVAGTADDGALLLRTSLGDVVARLDPGTTEPTVLHAGYVVDVATNDDAIWAWDYDADPGVPRVQGASSALLRIPIDGGSVETVVGDVHQPLGLSDGRWVTVRDPDVSALGELWVVDPSTGDEGFVDGGVDLHFARLHGPAHTFPWHQLRSPQESFFYTVREADERSGLWRVALAPR